jgi:hypothetical protein
MHTSPYRLLAIIALLTLGSVSFTPTPPSVARAVSPTAAPTASAAELPRMEAIGSIRPSLVQTAALSDSLAIVGDQHFLNLLDASDPTRFVLLGRSEVGQVEDLQVVGTRAYLAAGCAFKVLDVGEPARPRLLSTLTLAGCPSAVYVDGSRAFVAVRQSVYTGALLQILDLSNPEAPAPRGSIALPQNLRSLKIEGTRAMAVLDPGYNYFSVIFLDVGNSAQPRITASISANDAALAGNIVYLATSEGLEVVDLAQLQARPGGSPPRPRTIASLPLGFGQETLALSGTRVYLASSWVGGGDNFHIVDVSSPTQPRKLGSLALSNRLFYSRRIVPAEGRVFLAGEVRCCGIRDLSVNNQLLILDVSDPTKPREMGISTSFPSALAQQGLPLLPPGVGSRDIVQVSGEQVYFRAYDRYSAYRLSRYGVKAALSLVELDSTGLPSTSTSYGGALLQDRFRARGGAELALVGDLLAYGGAIYRAEEPREALSTENGALLASNAQQAVFEASPGLLLYDLSEPATPRKVAAITIDGLAAAAALDARRLVVLTGPPSSGSDELRVYELSDPAAPRLSGALALTPNSYHQPLIVLRGDTATVAVASAQGIEVQSFDLSQEPPRLRGSLQIPGSYAALRNFILDGDRAALSYSDKQSQVYATALALLDLANPDAPAIAASFPGTLELRFAGDLAYMLRRDGLYSVDLHKLTAPTLLGGAPVVGDPSDLALDGSIAYVAGTAGVRAYSLARPDRPFAVADYPLAADPDGRRYIVAGAGKVFLQDDRLFAPPPISILRLPNSTLSGRVTLPNREGLAGVSLTLSNGAQATSAADGSFSVASLAPGSYVLTPTVAGLSFEPPTRTLSMPGDFASFVALPAPAQGVISVAGGQLVISDTQGLTTSVLVAPGTFPTSGSLALRPTLAGDIEGQVFAGHALDLEILFPARLQAEATTPMLLSVGYSPEDIVLVRDESALTLRLWDGREWRDATSSCGSFVDAYTRDLAANRLSLPICQGGRYALFGPAQITRLSLASR